MLNETASSNEKIYSQNQILIQEYSSNMSKFQFDKAKTIIEKSKENSKIFSLFHQALINFSNGEKNYNNLVLISQRYGSRIGDRHYESAFLAFEQVSKETSSNQRVQSQENLQDLSCLIEISSQLNQLIEFRYQMIMLYSELKDKELRHEKGSVELALKNLQDLREKYFKKEFNFLIENLISSFNLEINILVNLLNCHIALDYKLDCIKSIVAIKKINDIFNNQPVFQASKTLKENKSFIPFSKPVHRQQPQLYQWFKIYYKALLNKFSILMNDSFMKFKDINNDMKEQISLYSKLMNFTNKFLPNFTAILFDSTLIDGNNFRGNGYEVLRPHVKSDEELKCDSDLYSFVFSQPKLIKDSYEKHIKNVVALVKSDFDSKVKYHFDSGNRTSYYLCKISDYYTFIVIFEMSKQEPKTKVASMVQEIGTELNLSSVFCSFNQNLK
ncbi:hypothetical protein BpHYR1_000429 [Brachionus plicatilis]|uniref:Uncharacterized protein n=1 Tax=Brachionus plicatilis TaxID=10195 RepID=A0A3M7Q554_BRAPC|nr:hypothetical protein BpHYR1_000429 [Brachionus plicatilis]